ncbi:hypothetical protein SNE40_008405 [Patella caerulea]|uniref:Elongation of very long chain fatty acids protein n=1 Tax=Patella caerulea TaxID=87958 RepID=A0AAN8K117_PATCE
MDLITDKITELQEFYDGALKISDHRVEDWLLMGSYTPTLALTALYLVFVFVVPKLMAKREAMDCKRALMVYNFSLIILNLHICTELLINSYHLGYSYICQPVSYSDNPREMRIAKALWWFYFSKVLEMLDTVFFILRKKNNQVSFLHVYHHATMFPIWWIGIKWVAGGQSFFGAMMNSFIHVLMYTYYGVSALGPQFQKFLWWKRYLTRIQLIQFVIGITHAVQSLVFGCDFPAWMHWALIFYGFSILFLFLNFYFHAYIKAQKDKKQKHVQNGKPQTNGHVESKKKL